MLETIYTPALILLGAYILDRLLGDPTRLHPIVGFGKLISWGERIFNQGTDKQLKGGLYNISLVIGIYSLAFFALSFIEGYWWLYLLINILGVFYMLSGTTLIREVKAVFDALEQSLDAGRKQVARIVGRDTAKLSRAEVQKAALETLSENLSDGVVAPLFWWAVLGLPGMLAYKMINTQDSMIGYKSKRYAEYGYYSAKLDDLVNLIPARLTAGLMLLVAGRCDLISFVMHYGKKHLSPNSGYPEASLAGILDCQFGGAHDYFGQMVSKPLIGKRDRPLSYADMLYAIKLNRYVELVMLLLAIPLSILIPYIRLALLLALALWQILTFYIAYTESKNNEDEPQPF